MSLSRTSVATLLAAGVILGAGALAGTASAATACVGAGVVTRIDGDPGSVTITRGAASVPRPRVLEVVCVGDKVAVAGAAQVTLSLDGRGVVKVAAAAPYQVAERTGQPSIAGNAYRAVNEQVMPDMKRLPWDVRLKGPAGPFAFALPQLTAGSEELPSGERALLLRLTGGTGPYTATLLGPGGQVLGQTSGAGELLFSPVHFAPGHYHIKAADGAGGSIEAQFDVAGHELPVPTDYQALSDPEVRAAATACALARADAKTRALEAEQLLADAPRNGLDRGRVYNLIESYGSD